MTDYTIQRWDAVLSQDGINSQPMIYIKPDIDFVRFAEANKGVLLVKIAGTNKVYDAEGIVGVVNRAGMFMPNYFNLVQEANITLMTDWYGLPFPSQQGTATFYGFSEIAQD